MTSPEGPAVSIVVPVYNSAATLARCLASIASTMGGGDELIVVDDGSTDDVPGVVARFAEATLHRLERRSGVAAARNRGTAAASRPVLMFVDADVVLHADALERGRAAMADSSIAAVIGAYDDEPEAPTLVSRFKNLAHHHFHARSAGAVSSFWGACGFIRRDVLQSVGGFDASRFTAPSIEDVELGWRVTAAGGRIVLDPRIQVTHLKQWRLGSLVATDIRRRAIPWTRLALERRRLPPELNVTPTQKAAAALALAMVILAPAALVAPPARLPLAAAIVAAAIVNRRLFAVFWRCGGVRLLIAGAILQQLYYIAAAAGTAAGLLLHCAALRRVASRSSAQVPL